MGSSALSARLGRLGLAAILLLASAGLIAPILLSLESAEAAVRLNEALRTVVLRLGIVALGLSVIAVLAWPPALPSLRLWWRRFLHSGQASSAAVQEAVGRLRNFDNPADRITMARSLADRGEHLASIEHWHRALEQDQSSLTARDGLGRALAKIGEHEKAITLLQSVRSEQPDFGFGDTLRILGRTLLKSGRYDEAAEVLEQHEQIAGTDRRVDLLRMRVHDRLGQPDVARQFRERARAPLAAQEKIQPEMALARARARVARLGGRR
ncbi:MAG: tetratricopeptide repeat protein [Planctomycetota bacterium]